MSQNTGPSQDRTPKKDEDLTAATTSRRGRPRAAVTTEELFRLGSLQCTQAEAATYFGCTERTIRRRLTKPNYREAWESGRARGRVSFRRLGLRHAAGSGPAGVAAWIHMSKFILGYSEKILGQHGPSDQSPNDRGGSRERLFERIARLAEQSHSGSSLEPPSKLYWRTHGDS
jgi:hypothetical protein